MALLKNEQKIRGTYEVERLLGEGAFAEVYRVRHRFLGRQAMKVFKQVDMTLEEIEALLAEAILLSQIGHPNIVRVFDANTFDVDGRTLGFFTMEYVSGGSLGQYWRSYREKLMPVEEAVAITKQVCTGIAVGHSESPPVIHRDIKPQNIMIGYDGNGMRIRVSDFGLARRVNPLTLLASARGTLSFKPPEAFKNMDSASADVWAIGTTLYLLLTDTLPHPTLNERDIDDSARFMRPLRPARAYNIKVDPALDTVLARCLATDPRDRYPDACALLEDLSRWTPRKATVDLPLSETTSHTGKTALGAAQSPDRELAEKAAREALGMARDPTRLVMAADILEEALNKDPSLRDRYESQVKLWRRGICM